MTAGLIIFGLLSLALGLSWLFAGVVWLRGALRPYGDWDLFGGWVFVTLLVGWVSAAIVVDMEADQNAVKIELVKADWVCTQHRETTTYVQSGSVLAPITSRSCTQYTETQR